MRRFALIAAFGLATTGVAQAQIAGGGAIGGAVGGLTGSAGGAVHADPGRVLDGATGQIRNLDDGARQESREAADRLTPAAPKGSVSVGAGVRVAQGTRCYAYDDSVRAYPYDPVYREGYYYCERTGPGAAVGARVKTPG